MESMAPGVGPPRSANTWMAAEAIHADLAWSDVDALVVWKCPAAASKALAREARSSAPGARSDTKYRTRSRTSSPSARPAPPAGSKKSAAASGLRDMASNNPTNGS